MKLHLIPLLLAMLAPATPAEPLPLGAESRADQLRLQRGDVDAARHLERERIRLETEQLRLDNARIQLDNEKIERERREPKSRHNLPLIGE